MWRSGWSWRSARFLAFLICWPPAAVRAQGLVDMLRNFEAIDADVLNAFTFGHKRPQNRADVTEMDISDLDTSDILNCFSTLSYTCFQKKIIFYLDSLNRVDKINLFGGYMSFVRVAPGMGAPITEQLLVSRRITDEMSLGGLLRELFEEFVEKHVLRITVPVINARLDARAARAHCYDFSLADAKISNRSEEVQAKGNDPTCYRGDQSMVALSSAIMMKMLLLLPTLLKVIAVKAMFGLVMGVTSVILSKMALLPILLSYTKKNPVGLTTASSYRQGVGPTAFAFTTDNNRLFYQQEEQPGRITTAGGSIDNSISSAAYDPNAINDNTWSETKLSSNYNLNKDMKYNPRKDRYRSVQRRAISKPRRSAYPETMLNGRNVIAMLTTAQTNTEPSDRGEENDDQAEPPVRAKRWLNRTPIYIADFGK